MVKREFSPHASQVGGLAAAFGLCVGFWVKRGAGGQAVRDRYLYFSRDWDWVWVWGGKSSEQRSWLQIPAGRPRARQAPIRHVQ